MTKMLTQAEIDAMSSPFREIYLKQLQIDVLSAALGHLVTNNSVGAADIEDAVNDLQIELSALRARFDEMLKAPTAITPITAEEVAALKRAIEDLSAVVAANEAAGTLLANARVVVGKFA